MLLKLLAITSTILAAELFLFALFLGIGLLIRRAAGLRLTRLSQVFMDFWIGFSAVIFFLMLWNFAFPVNEVAFAMVSAAGICGLFAARYEIGEALCRHRLPASLLIAFLLAGLWTANISMEPMTNWDSGLYHVQAVKWVKSYAVVPGLANLHGPLAFNNTSFLYYALLDVGPWRGIGYHFANGLLVLSFLFQVFCSAVRFSKTGNRAESGDLFDFLLMACAVNMVTPQVLPSYATDIPMNLVLLAALSRIYRLLTTTQSDCREQSFEIMSVCMLLAVGVSLKFSSIVVAALCWLLMLVFWARRAQQTGSSLKKTISLAVTIPLLVGLSWAGRGIVQSGYPLFPVPFAEFPFDWAAPLEHAEAEYEYIVLSGQSSVAEFVAAAGKLSFAHWFPDWISGYDIPFDVLVPLGVTVVALIAWAVLRRSTKALPGNGWWLLAAILPALIVWFINTPEPRYAKHLFWGLAAVCGAQAYRARSTMQISARITRVLVIGLLLLGWSPAIFNPVYKALHTGTNPFLAFVRANLNRPKEGAWLPGLPKPNRLETYLTASGLKLYVPSGKCWDAPLPCTANPAPNLSLRKPGALERGFAANGGWRMRNWPYRWRSDFLPAWRAHRARTKASELIPESLNSELLDRVVKHIKLR